MNRESWKIRAAQLDLANQKETLEYIRSFIDFISQYNYNTLVLHLKGVVRTATFPYPSPEESYSPEEMKEVVAYAKRKSLDVIPVIETLGHTEQFLKHHQLKHLAELREGIPGRFNSSLMQVCPSLDETYRFFESYLADIAEIFPSQYLHVGCDEAGDLGFCSLCRSRAKKYGEHSLLTGHLVRLHRFVTGSLKKRMLIWDDFFEAYPESLKAIPRDIIMCSWFYDTVFDVPMSHFFNRKTEDVFRKYERMGFSYLICPREESVTNILSCTKYARRYNPLGGIVTNWQLKLRFLYRRYPVFAFAGLFWSTGQDENTIMKKVCRSIFGSDTRNLVDAVNLYARRGTWPKYGFDSPLTYGIPSTEEQRRCVETHLLTDLFGSVKVPAGKTTGVKVLEDIRTDLEEEVLNHDLRTIIPQFYEASALSLPHNKIDRSVKECAGQMRALAEKRALQWNRWRHGISPDNASAYLKKCACSCENLLKERKPHALLILHGFLPDVYGAPLTAISLWDSKKRSWEEVFSGPMKPRRITEGEAYYTNVIPVYKHSGFSMMRIDVHGYGGQGFRFVEMLTKRGRFIPQKIETTSGIVRDAEHLLSDDYRWTYLGETDIYRSFHDFKTRARMHSVVIRLHIEDIDR